MATGAIVARILTQYTDKGSKAARKDIAKLGADFDKFSKKATKVFAVAGVAALGFAAKIGYDSVKAAVEDQAAQANLANQLKNTAGATDEAVKSVERWISSIETGYGIADDQLRPALARLAAATGDVSSAQTLLALAMDVSAGSSTDLETVTAALSKAAIGNYTALSKLGIKGLDKVSIKAMSANEIFQTLGDTFAGAAATKANTLEGRMARLQLSFKNAKETLGYALLPAVEALFKMITEKVIPAIQAWLNENGTKLVAMFQMAMKAVIGFGFVLFKIFDFVSRNTKIFIAAGAVIAGIWAGAKAIAFIGTVTKIVEVFKTLRAVALGAAAAEAAATGGVSIAAAAAGVATFLATVGVALGGTYLLTKQMDKLGATSEGLKFDLTGVDKSIKEFNLDLSKNGIVIDKVTGKTMKLTKAELDAIQTKKELWRLAKLGVTPTSETDPIQLEAARLNLLKQQALGIEAMTNSMWAFLEAQLANNQQAQRYADILAVINDNKISYAEIQGLGFKWGMSADAALAYIKQVTGINNITIDKDFGSEAAKGWDKAKLALKGYLAELGAGNAAQTAIVEADLATQAAEEAAKAAEDAIKAAEEAAKNVDDLLKKLGINTTDGLGGSKTDSAASKAVAPTSGLISGFTPTTTYGSSVAPGSSGFVGPTINVTVNAGNVVGSSDELVSTVRDGILRGQSSGNRILLNALDL